jgi:hypothetical protein
VNLGKAISDLVPGKLDQDKEWLSYVAPLPGAAT